MRVGTPRKSTAATKGRDELHLLLFPLTRGSDDRLFGEQYEFELARSDTYANGVVYLAYRQAS